MKVTDTLQGFADKLGQHFRAGLTFGQPIESHGKTVIPVSTYGFGLGMGGDVSSNEGEDKERQSGGGGGGGKAEPLGVFEIGDMTTRFIPVIRVREILIALTIMCAHYTWYRIVKTVFTRKKK